MLSDSAKDAVLRLSATWRIRHGRYQGTIRFGGGLGSKTDWEEGIRGVRGTTFAVEPRGQRGMHASATAYIGTRVQPQSCPRTKNSSPSRLAGWISRCQENAQIPASCEPFGSSFGLTGSLSRSQNAPPRAGLTPNRLDIKNSHSRAKAPKYLMQKRR